MRIKSILSKLFYIFLVLSLFLLGCENKINGPDMVCKKSSLEMTDGSTNVLRRELHLLGSAETPYSVKKYDYDIQGRPISFNEHSFCGEDLQWLTDDDEMWSFSNYEYQDGKIKKRTTTQRYNFYSDVIGLSPYTQNEIFEYDDGSGNLLKKTYTYNDQIEGYIDYTYNENNQIHKIIYTSSYGTDQTWFTPDDSISYYMEHKYDTNQLLIKETRFFAGLDKIWFTEDDSVGYDIEYEYNANGLLLNQTESIPTIGIAHFTNFTYDENNFLIRKFFGYSNSQNARYIDYQYNTNGKLLSERSYLPGPNGVFYDADDVVSGITTYHYDSSGRLKEITFNSCADDNCQTLWSYQTTQYFYW